MRPQKAEMRFQFYLQFLDSFAQRKYTIYVYIYLAVFYLPPGWKYKTGGYAKAQQCRHIKHYICTLDILE